MRFLVATAPPDSDADSESCASVTRPSVFLFQLPTVGCLLGLVNRFRARLFFSLPGIQFLPSNYYGYIWTQNLTLNLYKNFISLMSSGSTNHSFSFPQTQINQFLDLYINSKIKKMTFIINHFYLIFRYLN